MTELVITMRHVREAKLCSRGAREFCQNHGIDWSDFLKNGVTESRLESTRDALAYKVLEVARGR